MEETGILRKDHNKHLTLLWLPLITLIEKINIIGQEAPSLSFTLSVQANY